MRMIWNKGHRIRASDKKHIPYEQLIYLFSNLGL